MIKTRSVLISCSSGHFLTHWSGSIGISGEAERIAQEGITRNYTLVGLPIAVKYDSTNSLLDPTDGLRAAATATPTISLSVVRTRVLVNRSPPGRLFLPVVDVEQSGRSVIALRGLAGLPKAPANSSCRLISAFMPAAAAPCRGYNII